MFNNSIVMSICLVNLVLVQGLNVPMKNRQSDENPDFRLGIVISPLMTQNMIREIGIYWNIVEISDGDELVLYDGEPEVNGSMRMFSFEPSEIRGFRKTGISGEFVETIDLTFSERCLRYYVAWLKNGKIRRTKCLETHPNWMAKRRSSLGGKRLNEIFIPGTHDSGSYFKNESSKMETLVDKYIITQDEDVLSQLIYGVRYLDIRVGRYPEMTELWWVNHGYFSVHPLKIIIDDVKIFLNNTQEIVIFDVQEFPVGFGGNSGSAHNELVAYLEEQFVDYLLLKTSKYWAMSLDEIWATGRRLIIGYDSAEVYPNHESTWQSVTHRWPNVKTLEELYKKIENFENGNDPVPNVAMANRPPSSVMAQLTPTALDVVLDSLGGLRKMAELVNINITDSYNDVWKCYGNIVSMDFIKSSGIIETALKLNDKRSSICHRNKS